MTNTIESIEYRGCEIRLESDPDAESPREDDNLGTMACWHRRYNLGDEQPRCDFDEYMVGLCQDIHPDFPDDQFERHGMAILEKHYTFLPLYLYDHGGISISTGAFSCPWYSGQVGIIYCSLENARKEWSAPGASWETPIFSKHDGETKALRNRIRDQLEGEVETYTAYLEGDVAGYVAEGYGEDIYSCWGFYPDRRGDYSYAVQGAKDAIDHWLESNAVVEAIGCEGEH